MSFQEISSRLGFNVKTREGDGSKGSIAVSMFCAGLLGPGGRGACPTLPTNAHSTRPLLTASRIGSSHLLLGYYVPPLRAWLGFLAPFEVSSPSHRSCLASRTSCYLMVTLSPPGFGNW